MLFSKSNPLIMIFNTSSTTPIRSLHSPYSIQQPFYLSGTPMASFTPFHLISSASSRKRGGEILLVGQSYDQSVIMFDLRNPADSAESQRRMQGTHGRGPADLKVRWNEDVSALTAEVGGQITSPKSQPWLEKAKTKSRSVNFRWAWTSGLSHRN